MNVLATRNKVCAQLGMLLGWSTPSPRETGLAPSLTPGEGGAGWRRSLAAAFIALTDRGRRAGARRKVRRVRAFLEMP